MYDTRATDNIPLWLVFLATVALVVLSIETGSWIARARRKHSEPGQDGPIGSAVGATLGLLAFMLAFTFGIANARRDTKRELFLDEVTAISTTYLRTGLIPELHQSEVRSLLKKYVDLRVAAYGRPDKLFATIEESTDIQNRLWTHAAALADVNLKNPDIAALFIDSLNEMIDIQT